MGWKESVFTLALTVGNAVAEDDCATRAVDSGLARQLAETGDVLKAAARPRVRGLTCTDFEAGTRCRGLLPGAPYVTNIFFPKDYEPQESLNAAVFFHGDEPSRDVHALFDPGRHNFDFARYAALSSKKRVILVPEQRTLGDGEKQAHFSGLATGKSFDAWIGAVSAAMKDAGALRTAETGKLALSGHSRAYTTLAMLARERSAALDKVHSVALFDGYDNFRWQGRTNYRASELLPLYAERIRRNGGIFYANSLPGSDSEGAYRRLQQRIGGPYREFNGSEAGRFRGGEPMPTDQTRFLFLSGGRDHWKMVSDYYVSFLRTLPE